MVKRVIRKIVIPAYAGIQLLVCASTAIADLPVYDATQVAFGGYTIVKRVWAETWRSWFWIGGDSDEAEARRRVIAQAESAGADAVVNLTCMARTDRIFFSSGHYCYGDAIKAKPK